MGSTCGGAHTGVCVFHCGACGDTWVCVSACTLTCVTQNVTSITVSCLTLAKVGLRFLACKMRE